MGNSEHHSHFPATVSRAGFCRAVNDVNVSSRPPFFLVTDMKLPKSPSFSLIQLFAGSEDEYFVKYSTKKVKSQGPLFIFNLGNFPVSTMKEEGLCGMVRALDWYLGDLSSFNTRLLLQPFYMVLGKSI